MKKPLVTFVRFLGALAALTLLLASLFFGFTLASAWENADSIIRFYFGLGTVTCFGAGLLIACIVAPRKRTLV